MGQTLGLLKQFSNLTGSPLVYRLWQAPFAQDKFAPVRKHWLQRALGLGEKISVRLPRENLTGTLTDVDEAGAAHLRLSSGAECSITLADFYDIVAP